MSGSRKQVMIIAQRQNVAYLDKILLDNRGVLKVVGNSALSQIPKEHLMQGGNEQGVYTFPTTELIEWLRTQIAGRKCIEICAGFGTIGRALGVTLTDSYMQMTPEMAMVYKMAG